MKKLDPDFYDDNKLNIEFIFNSYEEYEQSSYFGKYLENPNYIHITVTISILHKMRKKLFKNYFDHNIAVKSIDLLIMMGEAIEIIYSSGANLKSHGLLEIADEYQNIARSYTQIHKEVGTEWILDNLPYSATIYYSEAIVHLAKRMKNDGCDELIKISAIQALEENNSNSKFCNYLITLVQKEVLDLAKKKDK